VAKLDGPKVVEDHVNRLARANRRASFAAARRRLEC